MKFGEAIEALKQGKKVSREGWNGKNMFLVYVRETPDVYTAEGTPYFKAGVINTTINAHIDMYTADGNMQPGWLASQTDMLAEDWQIAA